MSYLPSDAEPFVLCWVYHGSVLGLAKDGVSSYQISYYKFERLIKQDMNDPDSYGLVESNKPEEQKGPMCPFF